jgi:hypothetical protein
MTDIAFSSKSERENGVFQEALAIGTSRRSHNMRGRTGMRIICRIIAYILTRIAQFKKRYMQSYGGSDSQQSTETRKSKKGMRALLRELSDDEDDSTSLGPNIPEDPKQPWLRHFRAFIDAAEQVPDGWSAVKWWGVSVLTRKV